MVAQRLSVVSNDDAACYERAAIEAPAPILEDPFVCVGADPRFGYSTLVLHFVGDAEAVAKQGASGEYRTMRNWLGNDTSW